MTLNKKQSQGRSNSRKWITLAELVSQYGQAAGEAAFDSLKQQGLWRKHPSCPDVAELWQVHFETLDESSSSDVQSVETSGQAAVSHGVFQQIVSMGLLIQIPCEAS